MLTDEGDGATQAHDGMLSPADATTANEMYATIGICEKGFTIPGAGHDNHVWNHALGQFYADTTWAVAEHGTIWVEMWR